MKGKVSEKELEGRKRPMKLIVDWEEEAAIDDQAKAKKKEKK